VLILGFSCFEGIFFWRLDERIDEQIKMIKSPSWNMQQLESEARHVLKCFTLIDKYSADMV